MSEPVFDSSAVLALIFDEPGSQAVRAMLPGALLSSVNLAEVVARVSERGIDGGQIGQAIFSLGIDVVPFDADQAVIAGELRASTRALGLSLGDRACLALAKIRGTRAVTTDQIWGRLSGSDIDMVRPGSGSPRR